MNKYERSSSGPKTQTQNTPKNVIYTQEITKVLFSDVEFFEFYFYRWGIECLWVGVRGIEVFQGSYENSSTAVAHVKYDDEAWRTWINENDQFENVNN